MLTRSTWPTNDSPRRARPSLGGDPDKADPEEMFVASLSSCHMLWFLSLARAERIRVTAYEDEPEGTMDGTRFTCVLLRPKVAFDGEIDDAQVDSSTIAPMSAASSPTASAARSRSNRGDSLLAWSRRGFDPLGWVARPLRRVRLQA